MLIPSLETMILFVLAINLAIQAGWLTFGAIDNLIHPFLNETYTAKVLDMEIMRQDYPEAFQHVAYRRVGSRTVQRILFRAIVTWELVAVAALWGGVAGLVMTMNGQFNTEHAFVLALAGSLSFTVTWGGFLVAGNYFCYWFGHEGGQNTHFQMTLWGVLTQALLMVGYGTLLS